MEKEKAISSRNNTVRRLMVYFIVLSLIEFCSVCVVDKIELSRLAPEDRAMGSIIKTFKRQFPYYFPLDSFDRVNFRSSEKGVGDVRNHCLVSGYLFIRSSPESLSPALEEDCYHYKKQYDSNRHCWMFLFPSGTVITLKAESLKIQHIAIGPAGYKEIVSERVGRP